MRTYRPGTFWRHTPTGIPFFVDGAGRFRRLDGLAAGEPWLVTLTGDLEPLVLVATAEFDVEEDAA